MGISEDILWFAAQNGLMLALLLCAIVLFTWKLDPNIWKSDVTSKGERGNRKGYWSTMMLMITVLTGFLIFADLNALDYNPSLSQGSLFVINVLMLGMYALVKFFVIDYLVYSKIQPGFMNIDDTSFNTNIFHHLKMMVLNIVYGGVFCYLAAIASINIAIY